MRTTGPRPRHGAVDATRGLALLGSAVATALLWLGGRQLGPGYRPLDGTDADRAVDLVVALLVDNRVLAVFALLLGFALAERLAHPGAPHPSGPDGGVRLDGSDGSDAGDAARARVLRRAAVLLGVGALHAALVAETDVLGALAVLLVLAVPLVSARTRTHVVTVVVVLPALIVHGVADGLGGSAGFPDAPADYLLSVVDRVGTWLLALTLLPFTQVGLLVAVVAGIRLARAGWLADPGRHRRGLLALGSAGAVVGLLGAWPYARVVSAGTVPDLGTAAVAGALSSLTGPAGAVGAVCLTVLVVHLLGAGTGRPEVWPDARSEGRPGGPLHALGRAALPAYLAHSVVLALVLAPWAGGLGSRWGSAGAVGLAVLVWAASLAVAGVVAASRARADGRSERAPVPAGWAQPTDRQGLDRSSAT